MATSSEYYQANRERIQNYNKDRYQQNKEVIKEYQQKYRKENKKFLATRNRHKRQGRQLKAIHLLGGKCSRCNEVFDPVCYDFHHIDPSHKEFTIGSSMLLGESRFFNEVRKCILLCANCHRLVHKELRG